MAAPRYSVLGLAVVTLLLASAASGSIFSKDETKVHASLPPLILYFLHVTL